MKSKAEILADLARNRAAIKWDAGTIRAELDFNAKLKSSVRSRPLAWLGGAVAIGYFFAGPKTRTKTVTKYVKGKSGEVVRGEKKKPRGFLAILFLLIKIALPALRPVFSAYAARRFGHLAQKLVR